MAAVGVSLWRDRPVARHSARTEPEGSSAPAEEGTAPPVPAVARRRG